MHNGDNWYNNYEDNNSQELKNSPEQRFSGDKIEVYQMGYNQIRISHF